jgi:Protein of unknown function (DUF2881).
MNSVWSGIVTIAVAIIGVAIVATLVSKNAQTPAVLNAAGNAFSGALRAATGPVSSGMGMGF